VAFLCFFACGAQVVRRLQLESLFKRRKVTKSLFADNQPFGLLRNFEINRSGGPRKQASMPDSADCAILGAFTRLHD
jgi:hypothetical protein